MKQQAGLLTAIILFACLTTGFAQHKHSFKIEDGHFVYDGKPTAIYSGEMHYARIPREYWKQRLQMAKAMGLNTITTYVFWNFHETSPGVWDFKTGNHNLREFIKTAAAEGLMVILRPGPYACAEWEFGGYPWWLQNNKNLVIRTNNKSFLDSCNTYITKLITEIKDLQITNGGPVIMIQAENEFGSYVAQRKDIPLSEHKAYSAAIKNQLVKAGVTVPLFTSDGSWLFEGGTIEGALPAANGEDDVANLRKVVDQYHGGKGPYMVAEYYPGWLDHWAEPFPKVSTEAVLKQVKKYLDNDVSFNFYMVHGGTNFGFTAGANYDKDHDLQPDMTSYDYDAPISEAGWVTPKYTALRDMFKTVVKYPVPVVPPAIPVITIPSIKLTSSLDLEAYKSVVKPVVSDTPLSFEALNQGYGYVMYTKQFDQPVNGKLTIKGLRDFATVYVNGERKGVLNRYYNTYSMDIHIPAKAKLEILVENMGRINYGSEINNNLKGIISPVMIDSATITGGWLMYRLPMDKMPVLADGSCKSMKGQPTLYGATFTLNKTGDNFLDMHKWGKGIVFINGHNLGRYWSVGPQQTLYVPGVWLKKGSNKVVIFEQLNDSTQNTLETVSMPVLEKLVPR
ncbi:MAG: beta-galactosidase [Ferruginibacter sp.]|uniref:glycoside hydrolase family 35 protein n=1 Tax=Ferruginibacter sp. TaxID=1940288 RepID=UPI002657E4AA|nr:beta-galactosidase family protein [Ferruginibacter sp.]MDB5277207.1 beta-galactosidase [Ferruginibacter sp.]